MDQRPAVESSDRPEPGDLPGDRPEPSDRPEPGERPEPGDRPPPGRRLDAPPSQRYVQAARGAAVEEVDGASSGRALVIGGLVALFHVVIMLVLGGLFDFTAGLLVVAFFLGRLTAVGVRSGGGEAISGLVRIGMSVGISLAAIALVQAGLWAIAGMQGGRLGFVDFIDQVYGPLALMEAAVAGLAAWWGAAR